MKNETKLVKELSYDLRTPDYESFTYWLMTVKRTSPEQAHNYVKYAHKMLRAKGVYENITKNDIGNVLAYICTSKNSKYLHKRFLTTFELYLEFKGVRNEQGCYYNFSNIILKPNNQQFHSINLDEMKIYLHCSKDTREKAIVMTFLTTGIRISELVNLNVCDVDFGQRRIMIRKSHKGECRTIWATEQCIAAIKDYFNQFNRLDARPDEPLFISSHGKRISNDTVQNIIGRVGKDVKLSNRVTSQVLRHSFAKYSLEHSMNVHDLGEQLRHKCLTTTQAYYSANRLARRASFEHGTPRL